MFKETLNLSKKLLMCAISIAIVFAFSDKNAVGQDFNNLTGGTYTVGSLDGTATKTTLKKNRGIIRMRGSASADGAINGLGTSDANRIQGTVIWAEKAVGANTEQKVQSLYYTSLGVQETGDKLFEANKHYYVSHEFLRYANTLKAQPLNDAQAEKFVKLGNTSGIAGLTALPTIIHECKSSFWYDGIVDQYVLGTILSGVGGTDNLYSILNGSNPADITFMAFTQTGAWIRNIALGGQTHIAPSGSLNIAVDYVDCIDLKDTTSIDDTIIIDTCSPAFIAENPDYVCRTDTNTCDTCDPCEESPGVSLGSDVVIKIDGTMHWEGLPNSDEMIPICMDAGSDACAVPSVTNREPSRVIYTVNATKVFPAHYGIIEFEDGLHNIPLNGEVYIKGQRPYALDFVGTGHVNTNKYKITFTDACADATYTSCGEVVGWIYRSESTDNKLYTYHNANTKVALNPSPSVAASQYFGLLSVPGSFLSATGLYGSSWTGTTTPISSFATEPPTGTGYVNRLWQVDYVGNNGVISRMDLGFLYDEIDAALLASWESMRTYEGYQNNPELQLLAGAGSSAWTFGTAPNQTGCKLSTGSQTKDMDLNGVSGPGLMGSEATDIADGSQILFGNVPTTIKSVVNGRWSNPATWGGITPTRFDSVLVRHLVYTGLFDNVGDIVGSPQWTTNEYDLPMVTTVDGNALLAKSVNIASQADIATVNTTGHAALIIGNHDIAGGTASSNDPTTSVAMDLNIPLLFGTVYNNNATLPTAQVLGLDLTATGTPLKTANPTLGGLFIMGNDNEVPVMNVIKSLENSGAFTNEGIIEFGHEKEQ